MAIDPNGLGRNRLSGQGPDIAIPSRDQACPDPGGILDRISPADFANEYGLTPRSVRLPLTLSGFLEALAAEEYRGVGE